MAPLSPERSGDDLRAGLGFAFKPFSDAAHGLTDCIVVLTDGRDNVGSQEDAVTAATQLKQQGVWIDVIGIGGSHKAVDER